MVKNNYLIFTLLITSFATAAAASSPPSNLNEEKVSLPCNSTYWDFGLSALYLKPVGQLLNAPIFIINNYTNNNLKSDWDWGYALDGSYHFNTGNDLNLSWMHFEGKFSNLSTRTDTDVNNQSLTLELQQGFKTNLDALHFELGQQVNLGKQTNLRFHAGAVYTNAKIKRNQYSFGEGPAAFRADVTNESMISKYQGAGPRLGTDLSHELGGGFSVFAQGAMALLLGEQKANLAGSILSSGNNQTRFFSAFAKHRNLVPELDAKLGAGYQWSLGSNQLKLMAGWMVQNYFSMLPVIASDGSKIQDSGLSLQGPFIKAKWVG